MSKSTHPALANLDTRLEELENQGYTIFPAYLDRATTAAMRAHIDHLAGPITAPSKAADRHGLRHPIAGEITADAELDGFDDVFLLRPARNHQYWQVFVLGGLAQLSHHFITCHFGQD